MRGVGGPKIASSCVSASEETQQEGLSCCKVAQRVGTWEERTDAKTGSRAKPRPNHGGVEFGGWKEP